MAVAAGWGSFAFNSSQSDFLRKVVLSLSETKLAHYKMIGTDIEYTSDGIPKDPCGGDSGKS